MMYFDISVPFPIREKDWVKAFKEVFSNIKWRTAERGVVDIVPGFGDPLPVTVQIRADSIHFECEGTPAMGIIEVVICRWTREAFRQAATTSSAKVEVLDSSNHIGEDEPAWQSSKEGLYLIVMVTLDDETDDVSYAKNGELTREELRSLLQDLGLSSEEGKAGSVVSSVLMYDHTGKQVFARDFL